MDPSKPFRAGFVCGIRAGWNLTPQVNLEFERILNEDDFNAGYSAGWLVSQQPDTTSAKELLPLVEEAWNKYADEARRIIR